MARYLGITPFPLAKDKLYLKTPTDSQMTIKDSASPDPLRTISNVYDPYKLTALTKRLQEISYLTTHLHL